MLFIVTGGTIDKLPVYLADGSFDNDSKKFGESHLPEMLDKARYLGDRTIEQVCMLDSLDMVDEMREKIQDVISKSDDNKVIITHGTDTMSETARFLKKVLPRNEKCIVLTGAMVPYSVGEKSEALFNLGNAIAYVQTLQPGVYIVMNGRAFDADNVRKDVELGVFTTLNP